MSKDRDWLLAQRLQKQFNEEAKRRKKNENSITPIAKYSPVKAFQDENINLIDPKLEHIDPNPDIHALFIHFDNLFFWKKLRSVEVKWSPRMTSCAGICCYQGRGGLCSIRLSLPLLKLRPRKDLVETLLHEMIHAYLFVTHNNRDRDGHGPEFHKHMHRINKSAGTKITVYHTFHDEVRSYQQHWWKCQGPCQKIPPYFGMVRRAMNRAPGPNDIWWADHQASCGGTYVKVREPEGYSASKKGKGGKTASGKGLTAPSKSGLPSFITPKKIGEPAGGGASKPLPKSGIFGYFSPSKSGDDQKTSKVGGFLGSKSSQVSSLVVTEKPKVTEKPEISKSSTSTSFVPFGGKGHVLGGGSGVQPPTLPRKHPLPNTKESQSSIKDPVKRSNGISDSVSPVKKPRIAHIPSLMGSVASSSSSKPTLESYFSNEKQVKCPVCNTLQYEVMINDHLDECIASPSKSSDDDIVYLGPPTLVNRESESWFLECPGCRERVKDSEFDHHLNICERICSTEPASGSLSREDYSDLSEDNVECSSCPICGQSLSGSALGPHLDTCLSSMPFDDDDGDWS